MKINDELNDSSNKNQNALYEHTPQYKMKLYIHPLKSRIIFLK